MSVGQKAFVGIGTDLLFIGVESLGLSPLTTLPLGFVLAGEAAAVLAPLLFRIEGAYFAIGTWVAAESVALVFSGLPALGEEGMSLPTATLRGIAEGRELSGHGVLFLIVLGVMAILVVSLSAGGLWGMIERCLGWSLLSTRRQPER